MTPIRLCLGDPATGERCNARVEDGSYCPIHAKQREAKRTAARAGDPRWTSRWRNVIRPQVLARDHHACRRCGLTKKLEVHHIDGNEANMDLSNLLTLCKACHRRTSNQQNTERARSRSSNQRPTWHPS